MDAAPPPSGYPRSRLALPFPTPGPGITNAYRELDLALNGSDKDRAALGNLNDLPRPWNPGTITHPRLREQLWDWLEQVTDWINTEHVWDPATLIPPCWPAHPHLVHEIAVLTDLRYKAGLALVSDSLEEWHRYALPAFLDRLRGRVGTMCAERHKEWPARSAHTRYRTHQDWRTHTYRQDLDSHATAETPVHGDVTAPIPRLRLVDGHRVDPTTGEVR